MSEASAAVRVPRLSRVSAWRLAGITTLVLLLGRAQGRVPDHPGCPFRAVTRVPCPFCGGTTAAGDLGRGHLSAALFASPIAVALLLALPFVPALSAPRWWGQRRRLRITVVAAVLIASEIWQLIRLHLL